MDKEIVKGIRNLATAKFIVSESSKTRGSAKDKPLAVASSRESNTPGAGANETESSMLKLSDHSGAAQTSHEVSSAHSMGDDGQSFPVGSRSSGPSTSGELGRYNGDHSLPLPTASSAQFPAWGHSTIASTHQDSPGGLSNNPLLGAAKAQVRFFSADADSVTPDNHATVERAQEFATHSYDDRTGSASGYGNPAMNNEQRADLYTHSDAASGRWQAPSGYGAQGEFAASTGRRTLTTTMSNTHYGTSVSFSHDKNNGSANNAGFFETNDGRRTFQRHQAEYDTHRFDSNHGKDNSKGNEEESRQADDQSSSILNGLVQLLRAAATQTSAPPTNSRSHNFFATQPSFTRSLTRADFPLMDENNLKESLDFFEDSLRIYNIVDSELKLQAAQVVFSRSLMTGFYKEFRQRGLTYDNFRNFIMEKDIPTFGIHRAIDFAGFHRSANEVLDFAWTAAQDPRPEIAKMLMIFCSPQQCHSQLMGIIHHDWPLFKRNALKIYTGFQKTPQVHHASARHSKKSANHAAPQHSTRHNGRGNSQTTVGLCYPHATYGTEAYSCHGRGCPMEGLLAKSKNE